MATFLQILGAVFLSMVVLLVLGFLYLRYKIRRLLKDAGLNNLQDLARGLGGEPVRLDLEQVLGDIDWARPERVESLRGFLRGQGFRPLGVFRTQAMGDLQLEGWADPSRSLIGVVYEHSAVDRPWIDLVCRYRDGRSFTATDAPQGGEIEHPPEKVKLYEPDSTPVALMAHLLAALPPGDREPAPESSEAFRRRFEDDYAEEMAWRLARGGPTEREIRATLEAAGDPFDEASLRETKKALAYQAAEKLEEILEERFRQETTLTVAQWEDARDRLVFVHERQTPERLNELVDAWAEDPDVDEDEDDADEGETPLIFSEDGAAFDPRAAFARYNEALPDDRRFVKLGELTTPVGADVYRAPGEDD